MRALTWRARPWGARPGARPRGGASRFPQSPDRSRILRRRWHCEGARVTVREVVLRDDVRAPFTLSSVAFANRYNLRRTASVIALLAIDTAAVLAGARAVELGRRARSRASPGRRHGRAAAIATGLRRERHSLARIVAVGSSGVAGLIAANPIAGGVTAGGFAFLVAAVTLTVDVGSPRRPGHRARAEPAWRHAHGLLIGAATTSSPAPTCFATRAMRGLCASSAWSATSRSHSTGSAYDRFPLRPAWQAAGCSTSTARDHRRQQQRGR